MSNKTESFIYFEIFFSNPIEENHPSTVLANIGSIY